MFLKKKETTFTPYRPTLCISRLISMKTQIGKKREGENCLYCQSESSTLQKQGPLEHSCNQVSIQLAARARAHTITAGGTRLIKLSTDSLSPSDITHESPVENSKLSTFRGHFASSSTENSTTSSTLKK